MQEKVSRKGESRARAKWGDSGGSYRRDLENRETDVTGSEGTLK